MTEAEDQELLEWCQSSARAWIDEVNNRIDVLVDKDDVALEDCSIDLAEVAALYSAAYDSVKMHVVVDKFEFWDDAAGSAIRDNYSNHLKASTGNQACMVIALANAAQLDSAIVRKTRAHIDAMITNSSVALANGVGVDPGVVKVIGWLTLISGVASFSPGAAGIAVSEVVKDVMTMANWFVGRTKDVLTSIPMEKQDEPQLDDTDPDVLKQQMSEAFSQVEEVIKSDRETLANDLNALFGAFKAPVSDGDPAVSSQIVPNPNGVGEGFGA